MDFSLTVGLAPTAAWKTHESASGLLALTRRERLLVLVLELLAGVLPRCTV